MTKKAWISCNPSRNRRFEIRSVWSTKKRSSQVAASLFSGGALPSFYPSPNPSLGEGLCRPSNVLRRSLWCAHLLSLKLLGAAGVPFSRTPAAKTIGKRYWSPLFWDTCSTYLFFSYLCDILIPDEELAVVSSKYDGLPAVIVVNTALRKFKDKDIFGWFFACCGVRFGPFLHTGWRTVTMFMCQAIGILV